ncbi:hypothetical protein HMPREF1627_00585, partial [Actinomyces sp. S6-Spd3]
RSISGIKGVNALAPKNPLEFGSSNLTVVYGNNGSGKSGYVRILKHVCGAREPGIIHKNIYGSKEEAQEAHITYEQGGVLKTHHWDGNDTGETLSTVDIFDTSFGTVFVNNEDEASYEPPILSVFSSLILACEKVASALEAEIRQCQPRKPDISADMKNTPEGRWYEGINAETTDEEITKHCLFSSADEDEMHTLRQRLAENSPTEKAKELRKQRRHVDNLVQDAR